jgi:hypothetical protein
VVQKPFTEVVYDRAVWVGHDDQQQVDPAARVGALGQRPNQHSTAQPKTKSSLHEGSTTLPVAGERVSPRDVELPSRQEVGSHLLAEAGPAFLLIAGSNAHRVSGGF